MLDRFLIVGAGGSGGRTLRLLRQDLRRRLDAVGFTGPFPAGWGFVHVDGPLRPDVDDVGPDPDLAYLGLASDGVSYRDLDRLMVQRSAAVRGHLAGGRPDPSRCRDVDPVIGMGQLRAAGRLVTGSSMSRLAAGLSDAYDKVKSAGDLQLAQLSAALGDDSTEHGPLWLIVVSSLAGGAGAGMFLDVCDVLRNIDGPPDARVVSLLYGPDVFDDVTGPGAASLMPNALGAYSELLASYWDSRPPATNEFALMTVPGLLPRQGDVSRGPTRPFIMSRTNGTVTLERQRDVFRLAGSALGAVMVSRTVQKEFSQSLSGNWVTSGQRDDSSGLTNGELQPISALGYGSIGIGRDRFSAYAIQRMTGELARRLLEGHREYADADAEEAAVLNGIVSDSLEQFLDNCGLREKGKENNQILDALRGGDLEASWRERLTNEVREVLSAVTSGRSELDRERVEPVLVNTIKNRGQSFAEERRADREANAQQWVADAQAKLIRETTDQLIRVGGRGTLALLDAAQRYLKEEVVPELRNDITQWDAPPPVTANEKISKLLTEAGRKLRSNSDQLLQATRTGIRPWRTAGESALTALAVGLILDYSDNCIAPLRKAIADSLARLQTDYDGTPNQPPKLRAWASGNVPDDLLPTAYESLLEDPATWPGSYGHLIQSQIGAAYVDEAIRTAWRLALDTAEPVKITAPWAPKPGVLHTDNGVRTLRGEAHLRQDALLSYSRAWLDGPDTPFHRFVEEPLDEWLISGDGSDNAEVRQLRFTASLQHVLDVGRPLIDIDATAAGRVHGDQDIASQLERLLTPLPISTTHPAAAGLRRVLERANFDAAAINASMGSTEKNTSYGVVTVLKGPVSPLVVNSVAEPIAASAGARSRNREFWFARRTRPLPQAMPVPPPFRLAMIRGWFVGRGLGLIDVRQPGKPKILTETGWLGFGPLLGPLPAESADVFGAIAESIPLAIVNSVTANADAMVPYRRLAEMGSVRVEAEEGEEEKYDMAADGLPFELRNWVAEGQLPNGALEPLAESGDDAAERADGFKTFLEGVAASYHDLLGHIPGAETQYTHPRRQWELAPGIIDEIGGLIDDLTAWGTTGPVRPGV